MDEGMREAAKADVVPDLRDLRSWLAEKRPAERRLTNRELLDRAVDAPTQRERDRAANDLLRQITSLCAAVVDHKTSARTAQEVEDLAQEVMLRLLQSRKRGVVDPTPAYIRKIVTNLLIDHVRFLQRRGLASGAVSVEENDEAAAVADPRPSVEEEVLSRTRQSEIHAALARTLKPTEAAVVWLRAEGASHRDIALELNLREASARKHCERGLKRLKYLSEAGALPAALALD